MPKDRRADKAEPRTRPVLAIKGTDEWADWLRRLADHASLPQTYVVDQALKAYARSIFFDDPMPKRLPR
jgi:predicted transcriptional regulator